VAWAARAGGAPVAAALRAQAAALGGEGAWRARSRVSPKGEGGVPERRTMAPGGDQPATSQPELLAHGRSDERTRRDAARDAWRAIIAPTLEEVLSSRAAA
jgi:hypothetical protein